MPIKFEIEGDAKIMAPIYILQVVSRLETIINDQQLFTKEFQEVVRLFVNRHHMDPATMIIQDLHQEVIKQIDVVKVKSSSDNATFLDSHITESTAKHATRICTIFIDLSCFRPKSEQASRNRMCMTLDLKVKHALLICLIPTLNIWCGVDPDTPAPSIIMDGFCDHCDDEDHDHLGYEMTKFGGILSILGKEYLPRGVSGCNVPLCLIKRVDGILQEYEISDSFVDLYLSKVENEWMDVTSTESNILHVDSVYLKPAAVPDRYQDSDSDDDFVWTEEMLRATSVLNEDFYTPVKMLPGRKT